MKDLEGKVAFITGGASGIGLAIARSLSKAGMKLAITDVEQGALDPVKEEFAEAKADAITLQVDVTNRDAMEEAARKTEEAFGKVHVVCNNAGVGMSGAVDKMDYADWDWVMGVNLHGVINGVQTFVKRIMAHDEGGHIVNTSSFAGQIPIAGGVVYGVTKYGVVGMSEIMREDLAPHDIGVSVLCPGAVLTNVATCERNRPAELQGDPNAQTVEIPSSFLQDVVMADVIDPAVVGDMVVEGIASNDPYIFSHPALTPYVEARFAAIRGSLERWAKYREEHDVQSFSLTQAEHGLKSKV